jgi:hypothetical protein
MLSGSLSKIICFVYRYYTSYLIGLLCLDNYLLYLHLIKDQFWWLQSYSEQRGHYFFLMALLWSGSDMHPFLFLNLYLSIGCGE